MEEPTRAMLPPKDDLLAIYDRQLEWTIEKAAALNWLLCMERNRAKRENPNYPGAGDEAERYRNAAFPKGLITRRPSSHYPEPRGQRFGELRGLARDVCEAQTRYLLDQTAHPAYAEDVDTAIKAMDQWLAVNPYSLPVEEIPDGWGFDYLCRTREGWSCRIVIDNQSRSISGRGPDPRSALLRACEAARGM